MSRINFKRINKEKLLAAILTLVSAAIVVTPLCGLLFQCGCDWPWAGLDVACNYFSASSTHRCPWCVSLLGGIASTGLATFAGGWTAWAMPAYARAPVADIAIRLVAGMMVFVLTASVAAVPAALAQAYPLGIGHYLR